MLPRVCGGMGLGSAGLSPPQLLVIVLDPSGVQLSVCLLWCSARGLFLFFEEAHNASMCIYLMET